MAYESPTHKVFFHARTPLFLFIRRAARHDIAYIEEKGGYKEGWDDTKDDVYSLFACAGLLARSKHSARTILYTHRGKCL